MRVRFYFDRLYHWKWGYVVASAVTGIGIMLLSFLNGNRSVSGLFTGVIFFGPVCVGMVFGFKKYGIQGFAEKILVVTIKSTAWIVTLLLRPVLFVGNVVYKFFSTTVPKKLPVIIRPLYHFCWGIVLSALAYYICWVVFSADPQAKDFGSINLFDRSYKVVSTGVLYVGFIMFFATIKFVIAYWSMFTNWLNKFNFHFQFVIHH